MFDAYRDGSANRRARWRVVVILAASAWWWVSPAVADHPIGADGNLLLGWCKRMPGGLPNERVSERCEAYILGVVDAHGDRSTIYGFRNCLPHSATIRQLRDIVEKWLQDHPEKLHLTAHGLVAEALSRDFPCPP